MCSLKSSKNEEKVLFYYLFIFGTYSYIFNFVIFCIIFSTPSQNVKFQIHQSYMEIGLPEVIKFCARKMMKKTHME